MRNRLIMLALALIVVSCSRSGGSAGTATTPSPVTFTPAELLVGYTSGSGVDVSFTAALLSSVPDNVFVVVEDPDGAIAPGAAILRTSEGVYEITVKTSSLIGPGRHVGSLEMHLCSDPWCTAEIAGSPALLPYDLRVSQSPLNISFAPSTLTAAYISGTSAQIGFTAVTGSPIASSVFIIFADTGTIFSSDFGITLNANGSISVLASTAPAVPPGRYQGSLEMRLCADLGCTSHLPGSPARLPYDIEVVSSAPLSISFAPTTLTAQYVAGDSIEVPFVATVSGDLTSASYIRVIDAGGVLLSNPTVSAGPGNTFSVAARTSTALPAGSYQGNLSFEVCLDASCTIPYPGSPGILAYDIRVLSNTNLTPLASQGIGDWETFQRDAGHRGYVPLTLDPAVFSPRWAWTTPDSNVTLTPVVTAGGLVYVSSSGYFAATSKLVALNESDGSVQWQYDFGSVYALNPPAVSGGRVFAATSGHSDTFMWAFPAASGPPYSFKTAFASQWEHYYAPTVNNGLVFTNGGYYGGAYAFSSTTGTVAWFANLSQYDRWTPAVDADYVYAYTGYMGLSILSRTTGSLVSRISDTSFNWNGYSINGSPVIGTGGSILCVNGRNVNYGNRLVSFSTTTVNWSVPGYFPSNPALANGVIYLTNETPYQLEARSEATGALLWSWAPTGAGEVDFYGNVVATDNLVFLSTNRRIYAIDRTTHLPVWSYNKPGDLAISDSGVLYITLYSSGTPTNQLVSVNLK